LIPRSLVPVVGVQGVEDPKGVSTVPSTTLTCSSSRCNCLCGPPLALLSAEALTNPYAFGRTPHSPVWVEDVFWEIRSQWYQRRLHCKPNLESRRADSNRLPLLQPRVIHQALQGCAEDCKCRIFRGVSFPCLAECCTVLRSRRCQSGINGGIAASRSCSIVALTCGTSSISLDAFGGPCHRREHGRGVGLATALTGERNATQKTCVVRSQSTAAVEHSRSRVSIQHYII
jgi:hypothetical protein